MFFWERYLHRQKYAIQLKLDLDPWVKKDTGPAAGEAFFDLTTEEGMAALEKTENIKVRTRRPKKAD